MPLKYLKYALQAISFMAITSHCLVDTKVGIYNTKGNIWSQ